MKPSTASSTPEQVEVPRFITLNAASQQTTLGASTLLAWERQGRFPRAVRLSATKRVWLAEDVNRWVMDQARAQQTEMAT